MDLENFFDSIKPSMVSKYINEDVIEKCFIDGAPRQGLPTSPAISCLAFISCDNKIIESIGKISDDIKYTRYADDLCLSFNDLSIKNSIEKQ
ncbi:hypothetical protein J4714_12815 [Staphylococcus epidermidis]|nr:hypothetical protein [Staphylococcus epidermidis]